MASHFQTDLFQKHNVHAFVLCGGSGTRLWPLSRNAFPKQFLSLDGSGKSLLQTSLARLDRMVPPAKRWLVLAPQHEVPAQKQCSEYAKHILVEPQARNTAPAVALAARALLAKDPDSIMVILSSDHAIANIAGFEESLARAVTLASEDRFVVVGIRPTAPATGFGYIETGASLEPGGFEVASFREKPNQSTAEEFLLRGNYLWNAGMFIWKTRTFWKAFSELAPHIAGPLERATPAELPSVYASLPKEPIDIAFMEKASNVACVPSLFDWNDVGSWAAVRECFPSDEAGNSLSGDVLAIETKNSVVQSTGPFVATVGVENLVVVASLDAVLVMPTSLSQDVKKVITTLEARGRKELL